MASRRRLGARQRVQQGGQRRQDQKRGPPRGEAGGRVGVLAGREVGSAGEDAEGGASGRGRGRGGAAQPGGPCSPTGGSCWSSMNSPTWLARWWGSAALGSAAG